MNVIKKIAITLAIALSAFLGLSAIGLFLKIPGFNTLGSGLTMFWFWVVVVCVLLGTLLIVAVIKQKTVWRIIGTVCALSGVLIFSVVGVAQVRTAKDNDVKANIAAVSSSKDVPDEELTYIDMQGNKLPMAVYKPKNIDNAPVIMWIHGGGWIAGSYDKTMHNRYLADQGYLVVSAEYTLSDAENNLWQTTGDQLLCAMGEIADYASGLGADTSKIATMGDSAGGHLALLTGYTAAKGNPCGGKLPEVAAVAPIYPVASPSGFYNNKDLLLGSMAKTMAGSFTGGSPEEAPEAYAAVEITNLVDRNVPPTSIVVGTTDHLVPPEGAYELGEKLRKVSPESQLIKVPYGEHGMDSNTSGVAAAIYRETSVRFLEAHGLVGNGS